jgi:hypothetical protein
MQFVDLAVAVAIVTKSQLFAKDLDYFKWFLEYQNREKLLFKKSHSVKRFRKQI